MVFSTVPRASAYTIVRKMSVAPYAELNTGEPMKLEAVKIENYKALREVSVDDLTPLAAFVGANGAGKSSLFDALVFLHDCLSRGVAEAASMRGGFREIVSRGSRSPIAVTIKFRGSKKEPVLTYRVELSCDDFGEAYVALEQLRLRKGSSGSPWIVLDIREGQGWALRGVPESYPSVSKEKESIELSSPRTLAVDSLGQLSDYPLESSLRALINNWFVVAPTSIHHDADRPSSTAQFFSTRGMAKVARRLWAHNPKAFENIVRSMSRRINGVDNIAVQPLPNGEVHLLFGDNNLEASFPQESVSDGTLRLFSYLLLLAEVNPSSLLCIEEPEGLLHPDLLPVLMEELQRYADRGGQVLVSTHSPLVLDSLKPDQVYALVKYGGFSQVKRVSQMPITVSLYREGNKLGSLWEMGLIPEASCL